MTIPAGTHFGRYEIRSPIGAGGMGEVYLAHDAQLDRPVALKLLPANVTEDEDRLRRFQQEARATSALNHPNILTIYEIGLAEGTHFIATEFIDGITLRDQMARSRMKIDDVLEVSLQVASALAAAHEAGIVHRDIKPENIMIRRDGYVKVLDFGLAKLTEERANTSPYALTLAETGPGIVIGTVTYMSPEQARGLRVDERTDIFSFGVVLYEMLAGRAPFGGPTPSDVIVSILDRQPQPLAYHLPEVSPETQRIVSKALAKEVEERYQSVKEMLADLRGLKRGIELAAAGGIHAITAPVTAHSSMEAPPGPPEMTVPRSDARTVRVSANERETNDTHAAETLRLDSNQPSTPEIAHVLFMDIVGFSKHRIHQQSYLQQKLNEIVSNTDEFRRAQANDQLICKSTGDGMALVFFVDPEAPVRCALQISRALLSNPDVQLRMGIHSGPVLRTIDANRQKDVAGSGINIAQRVMDCGDAGHILLSKTMADVLFEIGERDERIDDLGTTKVKHGVEVHFFNLYTDELGNPRRPALLPQPTVLAQTSSGSRRAPIDSLAVLPLANASADPGTEYLSDGITESIINTLSQLPGLKVMARATVFRYKGREVDIEEVRRDLGVRAVMTGRVLQFGDQLIIKTELVDTADGSQLWGEQYKRPAADIFEVQEEISKEISEKLRIKLTGEERKLLVKRYTDNTEAYRLYLKGRFCLSKMTKEALGNAIKHFQQAIETDPDYALAYAGLADAYYGLSSNHLPPNEAMPKAREAAERALQIDDTLAEAHASLGLVKAFYDWDWASAEQEYRRAIELNPGYASTHHWYGWYLALMGRLNEAIAEIKRASELDPLSLEINTDLGLSFLFARQYDRAIEQFEKALEMDPNFIWTHFFMGWAYEQKGNYEGAIKEFQKAAELDDSPLILAALGHTYVLAERRDEALHVLEEMKDLAKRRHVSSYHFAIIHAALGERDEAFEWLEKTYEARSEALVWLKVDPRLDTLRTDPRFIDLQRRVGLSL